MKILHRPKRWCVGGIGREQRTILPEMFIYISLREGVSNGRIKWH